MRADRLVAILLLLQHRGQVTAAEVADELEISERTAVTSMPSELPGCPSIRCKVATVVGAWPAMGVPT